MVFRLQQGRIDRAGGFSLVELVVVIVVLAIMSIGVVGFINSSSQGYAGAASRNQLSASGRVVIDRIVFELRNALPNSIRINTAAGNGDQCLEFIPVIANTAYIDAPFGSAADQFRVVGFDPDRSPGTGLSVVIFGNDTADIYAQPIPSRGPRKDIELITDNGDGTNTIELSSSHRFARRSPLDRVFLVDEPVSFCVVGSRIFRYEGYGFNSGNRSQPTAIGSLPANTAAGRVLIGGSINNAGQTAFNFLEASRVRNAILQLDLSFTERGESIRLTHEVMLQGSP